MDEPIAKGNSFVLFYCDHCGLRIPLTDVQSGKARMIDETRAVCGTCCAPAPKSAGSSPPQGTRRDSKRTSRPTKSTVTSQAAPRPNQTGTQARNRNSTSERKKPFGALAIVGAGAGSAVLHWYKTKDLKGSGAHHAGRQSGPGTTRGPGEGHYLGPRPRRSRTWDAPPLRRFSTR